MPRNVQSKSRRNYDRDAENTHWLGIGAEGQDTLLLEVEPYQYVADQALCRCIRNWFFAHQRDKEKPLAMLLLSDEQIGYQLGFLSQYCDVFLWANEVSELQEQAAERFRARIIDGPLPENLLASVDLIHFSGANMKDASALSHTLHQAFEILSGRGLILAAFPAFMKNGSLEIQMLSENLAVADLEKASIFLLPAPSSIEILPFDRLNEVSESYFREFLKRHESFFGKGIHGAFRQHIEELDFSTELFGADARQRFSVLCVWGQGEGE